MSHRFAFLAFAVASMLAATPPASADDPAPTRCSANGISAGVGDHFSGVQLQTAPSPSCTVPLLDPETQAVDATSAVTLSLTADGLTASFVFAQPQIRSERSVFRNDNVELVVHRVGKNGGLGSKVLAATADPNGHCVSVSSVARFRRTHDQCSAQISSPWNSANHAWSGTVTIAYGVLEAVLNGDRTFSADIRRVTWAGHERTVALSAGLIIGATPVPFVTLERERADLWSDRYATVGADLGQPVGVPPHRLVTNVVGPLDATNLVTATFADDAGKVLGIRDGAVKNILDNSAATSFACRSCGSFLSGYTQPFDLSVTSGATLGVDLSSLGTDTTPFNLDAISFPLDAGYKFIHTGRALFAAALFNGTTGSNGAAHDGVAQYQNAFFWKDDTRLQLGIYHAVANRSEPGTAPTGTYPALDPFAGRSVNTQISAAFSGSKAVNYEGVSLGRSTTYSALVRYGTQYSGASQTFDAAFSTLRDPAVFDVNTVYGDKRKVGFAVGYRAVGAAYAPLDADYDLHTGERGFYGLVELTSPVCNRGPENCALRTQPFDAKVSAYRFSDSRPRDVAVSGTITYPFFDTLSLSASYSIATLSVSQAGRANDIFVSDALGGGGFLPNGQRSANLTYTANTGATHFFVLSAGYAQAQAQGCNPSALQAPPPCYGFRSPSATGSLFWRPFRSFSDLFFSGSVQNSTSEPFATGANAIALQPDQNFFATTASHVVRTAAVGAHLFAFKPNGCSTLLLTTSNRGGNADHFTSSAPKPGFTNTASLELVPAGGWPTILAAYSRVHNLDPATPSESLFVVRVQYGVSPRSFAAATAKSCSG